MLPDLFDPYKPYFSLELEADLLKTLTRRLGKPPTTGQLAAYRLYLHAIASMWVEHVERVIQKQKKSEVDEEVLASSHMGSSKEAMGLEPENPSSPSDLDDEVIGCA